MSKQTHGSVPDEGEQLGGKGTSPGRRVMRRLRDLFRDSPPSRRMPLGIVMRDNDGNVIRIISGQDGR